VNGFLNRTNVAKYLQRGHPYSIPYLVAKIFLTHKTALNILRPTKRKFLSILLMHAMGPNVAGVIGTAVAAGVLISILK